MAERDGCPECGARRAVDGGWECGCAAHGAPGAPDDARLHVRPYVHPAEPERADGAPPAPTPSDAGAVEGAARRREDDSRQPKALPELPALGGPKAPLVAGAGEPGGRTEDVAASSSGAVSPSAGAPEVSSEQLPHGAGPFTPDGEVEPPGRPVPATGFTSSETVVFAEPVATNAAPDAPTAHERAEGPPSASVAKQAPRWYRRPATALLATGAAAVLGAAVLTGQLLSHVPGGERDTAAQVPQAQPELDGPAAASQGTASPSPTPSEEGGGPPRGELRQESATQPAQTPSRSPSRRPSAPPTQTPTGSPEVEVLRLGDSGPEVEELVERLKTAEMLEPTYPNAADYTPEVQAAVARFQRENDVQGDTEGEYGEPTRTVLEERTAQRAATPDASVPGADAATQQSQR